MRLLFVCTGNLCRSAVAHGLAEARLARGPRSQAAQVHLLSAGTNAPVGEPMDPHSAAALVRLGGDPAARRASALTAQLADSADLVLTMTRGHRAAVLQLSPRGLRRTFTLREAADLLRDVETGDLGRLPPDQRARELAFRLAARRAHRPSTEADDIVDPIGRGRSVHDQAAETIAEALEPLLDALFCDDSDGEPLPAEPQLRPGG